MNPMCKCPRCSRNIFDDRVALHRVNPKGVKGIFVCDRCLTPDERQALDPETCRIVDIIRQDQYNKDQP